MVSVPVLSVQITVALPSVSTAGSRRISTLRWDMRWTPMASAIVTIAGSPSGTAATASDTADMNTSMNDSPRARPTAAVTTTMPRQSSNRTWLTRASRACSGVVVSSAVASSLATLPSSVAIPVPVTSATPVPVATEVPRKTKSRRSASGASPAVGAGSLSTSALSPVSGASFVDSRCASISARVGRHHVPGLQQQDVARDDVRGRDDHLPAVATDARARRRHRAQRLERVLRALLLKVSDQRVHHDDHRDGDRIGELAQRRRDAGRGEQQQNERAGELAQEHLRARRRRGPMNLVRADGRELATRLVGGQARRRPRRRRRQHFGDR